MGVSTEIAQHIFRPSEGPLGVDYPIVAEQHSQPGSEGARLRQRQISITSNVNNPRGAALLLQAALGRLERYPARFGGISVALLCDDIREFLRL
jgi:hypothetical protein